MRVLLALPVYLALCWLPTPTLAHVFHRLSAAPLSNVSTPKFSRSSSLSSQTDAAEPGTSVANDARPHDPRQWTKAQVQAWLDGISLISDEVKAIMGRLDGARLIATTKEDLRALGRWKGTGGGLKQIRLLIISVAPVGSAVFRSSVRGGCCKDGSSYLRAFRSAGVQLAAASSYPFISDLGPSLFFKAAPSIYFEAFLWERVYDSSLGPVCNIVLQRSNSSSQ